ncbi:MAG: hypothetical protein B6241_02915 [Spirochaetaceae bacterium 4572_59]|nr:MAG: hypothetical protein B6241_02915 [Spirochaetaceae bacterium 4572_59]
MLNRVLVQISRAEEVEYLARFTAVLKKRYPRIDISGLYVRNVEEYMKYNSAMYSDTYYHDFQNVWKGVEDRKEQEVKEKFEEFFNGCSFISKNGYINSIVLDQMRASDLLILAKQEFLNHEIKSLLRTHHKPIVIVPERKSYSMDKILVADDERLEVNKAFFNFMYIFEEIKQFQALAVNIDQDKLMDLNIYLEKTAKKITYDFKTGHVDDIVLGYMRDYDLLIMGDLKHSFMIERIAGKPGIKILEKTDIPVYIA